MANNKRARKKQGREARLAEVRARQQRARRNKRVALVAVIGVAVAVTAAVFGGGETSKAKKVAAGAGDATTTTAAEEQPTTSAPAPGAQVPCPPAGGTAEAVKKFDAPPPPCIDAAKTYAARVETDIGVFTIALDAKKAPKTVNNFVFLARHHFYDSVPFHRVIPGFVVQGGDGSKGDGTGDPGYRFEDELPKAGEYEVGSVAMANSGPDTNGSQFFVVTGPQGAGLPPSYSLFGKVTEGLDVVKKIEADGTDSGTPKKVHTIVKVTITET